MAKQEQQQQVGMDATPEQQASMVHLGKMMGDPRDDFDREVEKHLDSLYPHEAGYQKEKAALSGGQELGPSDIDKEQLKQQQAQSQTQAAQSAAQAQQAQGQQMPVNAPPAPTGPAGVSTPYPAQNAAQGPPSAEDVEPQVPGVQSPASQIQPPPAPDQGGQQGA
jgi:hypothetical protein